MQETEVKHPLLFLQNSNEVKFASSEPIHNDKICVKHGYACIDIFTEKVHTGHKR